MWIFTWRKSIKPNWKWFSTKTSLTLSWIFSLRKSAEERKERGEKASLWGLDYLVKYAWQAEFLVIAGSGGRSSRASLYTVCVCACVCVHRKSQCVGKHALVTWPVFIWPPKDASRELIRNKSEEAWLPFRPFVKPITPPGPGEEAFEWQRRESRGNPRACVFTSYEKAGPCIIISYGPPWYPREFAFLAEIIFFPSAQARRMVAGRRLMAT